MRATTFGSLYSLHADQEREIITQHIFFLCALIMFFLDGLFWFLCFFLIFDLWAMSWIYYAPMCTLLLCDLLCNSVIVWCCLLILSNLMAKKGEYCNVRNNIIFLFFDCVLHVVEDVSTSGSTSDVCMC